MLGGGLNLVNGNAAKVVLIAVYTPVALLLFARAAQVDVAVGLVLSVGQVAGAWTAAHLALARGANWGALGSSGRRGRGGGPIGADMSSSEGSLW